MVCSVLCQGKFTGEVYMEHVRVLLLSLLPCMVAAFRHALLNNQTQDEFRSMLGEIIMMTQITSYQLCVRNRISPVL